MIPKKIHYCWFGGKALPREYERYIESWRRFFPDYEICRWDESNYDVNCIPFSREAYSVGKFAYVSDYARLRILYEKGGVYFDTDVEVVASFDDILSRGGFMGFEKNSNAAMGELLCVNPGLGFAVEAGNPIIREALDFYESHHYIYPDGHMEQITIVTIVTDVLRRYGLSRSDVPTTIGGITIYPWDYFCPVEFMSSKLEITDNTRSIHHYSASWMSWSDKLMMKKGYYANKIRRILGVRRR
jgi:mannosyltransferase OCH1-like enzyme